MNSHYRHSRLTTVLLICILSVSCSAKPDLRAGQSVQMASYTDPLNDVVVSVRLSYATDGAFLLAATFTPPEGFHLYSKDLPRGGLNGQGRPTLLELATGSKMQPAGMLTESVGAELAGYQPDGLLVYPTGPVTLTLAVSLPDQTGWVEDTLSLTYTACTASVCLAPTVGKLVKVTIPGKGSTTK